jgi:hypothetical protein
MQGMNGAVNFLHAFLFLSDTGSPDAWRHFACRLQICSACVADGCISISIDYQESKDVCTQQAIAIYGQGQ